MRLLFTALSCLISVSVFGQGACNNQTSVTYQGYEYDIVEIGDQCWFAKNCRYLPEVYPSSEESEIEPYYYVYDYEGTDVEAATSTENYQTYGVLYNWPAVMSEEICPSGWHIPSDEEFTQLTDFLGGESVAGGKMKEADYDHWYSPNTGATNSSGWTGLPGGYRYSGGFYNNGYVGYWWSASESDSYSWTRSLFNFNDYVLQNLDLRGFGFSARCVTNQVVVDIGLDYDGNGDGCVDVNDMLDLLLEYGQCEPEAQLDFDGNGDGCVNGEDVLNILVEYGSCE